jgi:hypothetical protein
LWAYEKPLKGRCLPEQCLSANNNELPDRKFVVKNHAWQVVVRHHNSYKQEALRIENTKGRKGRATTGKAFKICAL